MMVELKADPGLRQKVGFQLNDIIICVCCLHIQTVQQTLNVRRHVALCLRVDTHAFLPDELYPKLSSVANDSVWICAAKSAVATR